MCFVSTDVKVVHKVLTVQLYMCVMAYRYILFLPMVKRNSLCQYPRSRFFILRLDSYKMFGCLIVAQGSLEDIVSGIVPLLEQYSYYKIIIKMYGS